MKKSLILTFYLLIGTFLFIVSTFFVPAVRDLLRGSFLFLLPFFVFFLLGIALIFLTLKEKIEASPKKFLLLTGASAAGFFVSIVLHNGFYALAMLTNQIGPLKFLMEALHTIFFLLAIPVCPIGFLVGVAGSIVMLIKKKKGELKL